MPGVTLSEHAHDVLTRLRPQTYGTVSYDKVQNPIVEPMWAGIRALAGIEDGAVALHDAQGEPVKERPEVMQALGSAVRTRSAVLDGWVTKEAVRTGGELLSTVELPTASLIIQKTFFGIRRDRQAEAEAERRRLIEAQTFREEEVVAFVATDLLWLDGESVLEVPLLERKRLLNGIIEESELVRLGAFVRPPVATWITSWRRLGFVELSYRGANSRYHPGEQRDEWTTARMPRR
jgi:bifunctional non-homologous end joining protein LigD